MTLGYLMSAGYLLAIFDRAGRIWSGARIFKALKIKGI
jgi:hypothetical protein